MSATADTAATPLFEKASFRLASASFVALVIFAMTYSIPVADNLGRSLPISLLLGAAFGVLLQRSRFCFFCVTRAFMDERDARGLVGIIVALIVGLIGYTLIFGAWLPSPFSGRLPPDAHIGPVSWVLALGALTFGIGMSVSGSCISAQLYRLGEGSPTSPFALLGALIGFVLGFLSWNSLYLGAIQSAPILWLPRHLGYAGALALQVGILALLALWLMRYWPKDDAPAKTPFEALFRKRWPTYIGGALIGALATFAYFRVGPLGVTAELGSIARTTADSLNILPSRLEGLDSFAGCATLIKETLLSRNGVFVTGLVLGSLASALLAGDFKPQWPNRYEIVRGLFGGVLMGWGAMIALGCTVGVLLSGIMAGAVSGWVFAVFCLLGTWLGWRVRQRFM